MRIRSGLQFVSERRPDSDADCMVDAGGVVLFADLQAPPVGGDRQMAIGRRGIVQQVLQIDLPRRGIQQISATHDLGDPLSMIINHHGEMIGVHAVGAADNKVNHVSGKTLLKPSLDAVRKTTYICANTKSQ